MASFSLSTVAGVPLGLFLADHFTSLGWRAPFFFIVLLSAGFLLVGYRVLPHLTAHLARASGMDWRAALRRIAAVVGEREHLKAFSFMALMMFSGFTVIPYIALYMTANVAMAESFLTVVYLCGGAATFFTSQLFGRLADRHGKPAVFRAVALAAFVPLLVTTHLVPVPWWVVLINSTAFFVLVSGRMVPAMAMVSAVAMPQVRGTFMSLVGSVQMLGSGLASLIAGMIITRNAAGQVEHYNWVGYLAVAAGMLSILLARNLRSAPDTAA
jgi:predicted MFS family arabinose efflux permease